MANNIQVCINYRGQVHKPLYLSTLSPAPSVSVRNIAGVSDRPLVVFAVLILAKPDKQECRGRRISVEDPKLLTHQLSHIDSVGLVVSHFMIPRHHAEALVCNRFEQFRADTQFLHRTQRAAVGVTDARSNRTIKEVSIHDKVHIVIVGNVLKILTNPIVVAVGIRPVVICHWHDFDFRQIFRQINLYWFHSFSFVRTIPPPSGFSGKPRKATACASLIPLALCESVWWTDAESNCNLETISSVNTSVFYLRTGTEPRIVRRMRSEGRKNRIMPPILEELYFFNQRPAMTLREH